MVSLSIKILLAFVANFTIQGGEFIKIIAAAGVPHSTVQVLDSSNFEEAITDPANGLWFLKFYAPWYVYVNFVLPLSRIPDIIVLFSFRFVSFRFISFCFVLPMTNQQINS